MRRSAQIKGIAIAILLTIVLCISYAAWHEDRRGLLTVSFLNIGQGDSIFIDAPSGRQVLIDGGPNSGILRELSKVMPWYDRSIDVVIPTHPDADHVSGLIDVLDRFEISTVVHSSVQGDTSTAQALVDAMKQEGAREITARRGQVIDLGSTGSPQAGRPHAYLEVLSPDRLAPHVDTNDGCVVTRLVYGKTSLMLSCDAPQTIENYLVSLDGNALHSDVLKAGHHGSKTSSSPSFLGFVNPEYGVYSRGCNNRYGHPAPETVARFAQFGIPTLDTCTDGTVPFVSDGVSVKRR